jgi:hypothetical protein
VDVVGEKKFLDRGCFGGVAWAAKRNREIVLACQKCPCVHKGLFHSEIAFYYNYLSISWIQEIIFMVISNFTIFGSNVPFF